MVEAARWGTWEELVLGSAVLRHGTANWETVASELRSRTAFPQLFTAQVCEARYVDLQKLYSGCYALFEELRERRVVELKRELAKTEDSIGSLESKLDSLKAEKESDCNNFVCNTSRSQSVSPLDDADGVYYSCKDGLSARSSTENTVREWTPECDITASVSSRDECINIQLHNDFRMKMAGNLCSYFGYEHFKKKRGSRKRILRHIFKEASVGERESTSSAAKIDGKKSFEPYKGDDDLSGILHSISKQKDLWIVPCRFDNQKLLPARTCYEENALAIHQAMEKGRMVGSPSGKRGSGRLPKGGRGGRRACQVSTLGRPVGDVGFV